MQQLLACMHPQRSPLLPRQPGLPCLTGLSLRCSSITMPLALPQLSTLDGASTKHQCMVTNLWSLAVFGVVLPLHALCWLEERARAAFEQRRRRQSPVRDAVEVVWATEPTHLVHLLQNAWLVSSLVWVAAVALVPPLVPPLA